jgi:ubiquinone/menaquinone biosynthesis C-methylase UbiE
MNSTKPETKPLPESQFDQFATGYDRFLWPLERIFFARARRQLIAGANGRVLELAVGTGVNLPLYPREACAIGLDNSAKMLRAARRRVSDGCMRLLQADAARLPFASNHFDAVISTLLYCSLDDPAGTLAEVRRVLRPGGQLMMMEHVRGAPPIMGLLTDVLNVPWHAFSRSCRLNRQPLEALQSAGFRIIAEQRHALTIVQTIIATPIP